MRRFVPILILAAFLSPLAVAVAQDVQGDEVESLLRDLGSDDTHTWQAADAKLREMGEAARDRLEAVADPKARPRAQAILAALGTPAAPAATIPDWTPEFLRRTYFGIALLNYALCLLAVLAGVLASRLIVAAVHWRLKKRDGDPTTARALARPLFWLSMQGGIWIGVEALGLPAGAERFIEGALKATAVAIVTWALFGFIDLLAATLLKLVKRTEGRLDDQLVPLVRRALKVFVVVVAVVLVLQNMGYSVTGLVAGMSVVGAAVALSAQKTLEQFFGGLTIFVERPFRVGDWIAVDGGLEGTVEAVGFRSTRIRTFARTLITVPNGTIASAAIENYSRMPVRRIKTTIGITYAPKGDAVRAALDEIRALIRGDERIDQTLWTVRFTDFQDSSLGILLLCFTKTTVWDEHLAVREDLLLRIKDLLEARGLEIAFPTRTIHLKQDAAPVDAS